MEKKTYRKLTFGRVRTNASRLLDFLPVEASYYKKIILLVFTKSC